MIRLGIFTDELSQDLEEAVKVALENDIRNLEIRGVWGENVIDLTKEEVAKVESIVDDYGATVASVGSPFLKCRLESPEECRAHKKILGNCIYQAHQYGTNIIRIFTFCRVTPIEKYWGSMIDKLKAQVRKAEREGVILAVETEGDTNVGSCSELRRLLDDLPSENVKACWDIANSYFSGENGYPAGYQKIRGEVVHLHLKDFVRDSETGKRKPTSIGEGSIPYERIFSDLLRDGFDGVASIEWGSPSFQRERRTSRFQAREEHQGHTCKGPKRNVGRIAQKAYIDRGRYASRQLE